MESWEGVLNSDWFPPQPNIPIENPKGDENAENDLVQSPGESDVDVDVEDPAKQWQTYHYLLTNWEKNPQNLPFEEPSEITEPETYFYIKRDGKSTHQKRKKSGQSWKMGGRRNYQPKNNAVICVKYGACEGHKSLRRRLITLIDKDKNDLGEYALVHIIGTIGEELFDRNVRMMGNLHVSGNIVLYGHNSALLQRLPVDLSTGNLVSGDVVGITARSVSKVTTSAHSLSVVVNYFEEDGLVDVCAIGKVKVKVRGVVRVGDLLGPSGMDDGYCMAIQSATPGNTLIPIGQALDANEQGEDSIMCSCNMYLGMQAQWMRLLHGQSS